MLLDAASVNVAGTTVLQERLDALAPALRPGADRVAALQRLSGGASQELWSFELRWPDRPPMGYVLRRAAEGSASRPPGDAGLAAEAQLMALAAAAGVPVPQVELLLQPEHELGEGFVMQFIAGETLGHRIASLPELDVAREQLARQCGLALARIHQMQSTTLPPLRRAPAAAERAHYEAQHRRRGVHRPVFELALHWLKANPIAEPQQLCLVHGDFRNGNLVVDSGGLLAVLDWELAHLGDPMEDLAWLCLNAWRFGCIDLPVGGFGQRADLYSGYAEGGGTLNTERMHHWEVLGALKWGLICEGRAEAFLSGAERDVEHAAVGRRASETEIDLLQLLAPR